ncbi:MAG: LysM peptidoglycan-binding domain-containing protein [Bacilli bacterium]|nr:LysM peptidoglycan-binding domain-containing protein [Bacilli bacterium]
MKKIVPFTKDLMFKTKIGEITSIALDNTLTLDLQNVSGEFIISGTYKILESSQLEEEFKYNIPVDITIDSKYETSSCSISIDDFSYEIINEEKLKVNISVMLDDLDIKEDKIEKIEVVLPNEDLEREFKGEEENREDSEFELLDSSMEEELENLVLENKKIETKNQMTYQENKLNFQEKLLENVENEKEYSIYRVYTVKEDDTLDLIYEKFNTTKEILSDYNDLDNLVVGSKIIIPSEDE